MVPSIPNGSCENTVLRLAVSDSCGWATKAARKQGPFFVPTSSLTATDTPVLISTSGIPRRSTTCAGGGRRRWRTTVVAESGAHAGTALRSGRDAAPRQHFGQRRLADAFPLGLGAVQPGQDNHVHTAARARRARPAGTGRAHPQRARSVVVRVVLVVVRIGRLVAVRGILGALVEAAGRGRRVGIPSRGSADAVGGLVVHRC